MTVRHSIVLDEIAPSILTDGRGDFPLDTRHGIAESKTERRGRLGNCGHRRAISGNGVKMSENRTECPENRRKCMPIGRTRYRKTDPNVLKRRTGRTEYRRPTHGTKSSNQSLNAPIYLSLLLASRQAVSTDAKENAPPCLSRGGAINRNGAGRVFLSLPAPRFNACCG